ncbi:MAG: hypothetical protein UV57_C0009G0015 [Parcubacteria group bacterium GW2011_GWD2_43_10]|nr:MAG: hypothetical protein UV57_C0009G0015 [Parcubacteria group bacterium GW2011_GWD2_43_10]
MYDQIAANKRKSWILVIAFMAVIALLGYFWGAVSGRSYRYCHGFSELL